METWLALIAAAVGLLLTAVAGLHVYMTATATPLHPDAERVPSRSLAPPSPAWAQAADRARRAMREGLAAQNLAGMSVAVGVGGEIVWTEGFGWAHLDDQVPVSPETRFRIGTASVALTSAAAGLLLEQGALTLDDEIQNHVPEFPRKPWPVTLRQVMGQVAGLRSDGGDESPLFSQRCERPVEALSHFGERALLFEPGTQYRYSNYGWILVSAAIESAARDEPFLSVMRDRVFAPLGMEDTQPDDATQPGGRQATSYFPRYAADPRYGLDVMRPLDYSCYAGASVFVSTPSDLVRFGLAMTRGTLLQPATVELLQASLRLPSGEETGYGLGWDLERVAIGGRQIRVVGHDGEVLGGRVASLVIVPERDLVIAVLSNTSYADTPALARQVAEAFTAAASR